jgi:hypothetical protein
MFLQLLFLGDCKNNSAKIFFCFFFCQATWCKLPTFYVMYSVGDLYFFDQQLVQLDQIIESHKLISAIVVLGNGFFFRII